MSCKDLLVDCDAGVRDPVHNLFFSDENKAHILGRIARETNAPGITSQNLEQYMWPIVERYPGPYHVQLFPSKDAYVDQVIRHVDLLNRNVVKTVVPEVRAQKQYANYYAAYLTGNEPVLDNAPQMKPLDQSRKSDTVFGIQAEFFSQLLGSDI